jgi:CubicO group peptidase (beta-lactamase class C family)
MIKARCLTAFLILAFVPAVAGQRSTPADGVATDRLARIDKVMQQYVDENKIPGAVALVLRDGRPIYDKAFGWSDKESSRKMAIDSIFRIASQSKALTSVAILILMEEGALTLATPVSQFIPSFAKTTVAVKTGEQVTTSPAKRAINIKDLLTHTAGISYGTDATVTSLYEAKGLGPAAGYGWYTADKDEPVCDTMERLGTLPRLLRDEAPREPIRPSTPQKTAAVSHQQPAQ